MSDPIILLTKAAETGVGEMPLADLVAAVADALPPPDLGAAAVLGFGLDADTSHDLVVGIKAGTFRGNSGQTFTVAPGTATLEDFTSNQYIYIEATDPAHLGEFRVTTNADHGGVGLWKFTTDSGAVVGDGVDMRAILSAPARFQITLDDENATITVPNPAALGMIGQQLAYYVPTLTAGHTVQFDLANLRYSNGAALASVIMDTSGQYFVIDGQDADIWWSVRASGGVVTLA